MYGVALVVLTLWFSHPVPGLKTPCQSADQTNIMFLLDNTKYCPEYYFEKQKDFGAALYHALYQDSGSEVAIGLGYFTTSVSKMLPPDEKLKSMLRDNFDVIKYLGDGYQYTGKDLYVAYTKLLAKQPVTGSTRSVVILMYCGANLHSYAVKYAKYVAANNVEVFVVGVKDVVSMSTMKKLAYDKDHVFNMEDERTLARVVNDILLPCGR